VRAEQRERLVEPAAGGRAPRRLVHDVDLARRGHGPDDRDAGGGVRGAPLERLDQAAPGHRLVRDDEDVLRGLGGAQCGTSAGASSFTPAPSSAMIACLAPSTPYS